MQDPKTICQTIGFCNATKVESKLTVVPLSSPIGTVHIIAPEPKRKVSSPQCVLCEFVMNKLEQMIGTNATEVLQSHSLLPVLLLAPVSSVSHEATNLLKPHFCLMF